MKAVRYLGFAFIPIKQNRSYLPWAGGAPNGAEIRPMQEEAVARKEDEEIEPFHRENRPGIVAKLFEFHGDGGGPCDHRKRQAARKPSREV